MRKTKTKKKKNNSQSTSNNNKSSSKKFQELLSSVVLTKEKNSLELNHELLIKIDNNLDQISLKNFDIFIEALVIYGNRLLLEENKYAKEIQNFNKKIKQIGKMPQDKDVEKYKKIWENSLLFLQKGEKFKFNMIEKSYFFYYFSYQLNQLISDHTIPLSDIAQSIVPLNLSFLNDKNLEKIFFAALTLAKEINVAHHLLTSKFTLHQCQLLMQVACAVGDKDVVTVLRKNTISFPQDRHTILAATNNAVMVNDIGFLKNVLYHYGSKEILQAALEHHFYFLAAAVIGIDENLIQHLKKSLLSRFIELASAQADLAILRIIFSKIPKEERKKWFDFHVSPYAHTDSVQVVEGSQLRDEKNKLYSEIKGSNVISFNKMFDCAINIVRYFMEKGLFTFSLSEENDNPEFFGPRACGYLRQAIAYYSKAPNPHCFGVIRNDMTTMEFDNLTSPTAQRVGQQVKEQGEQDKEFFSNIGIVVPSYQVTYKNYALSKYIVAESLEETIIIVAHTSPEKLINLSSEIQQLYKKLPKNITLFDNPFQSSENSSEILRNVVRLIWLTAHTNFYVRGSSTVLNIVHHALLLTCGLRITNEMKSSSENLILLDTNALSFSGIEKWVEYYPSLVKATDYENCIKSFGECGEKNNQSQIIDHLAQYLEIESNIHLRENEGNFSRNLAVTLLPPPQVNKNSQSDEIKNNIPEFTDN